VTCPRCGQANPDGAAACGACGGPLATAAGADGDPTLVPPEERTLDLGPSTPAGARGAARLPSGSRLGERYEILSVLGEGGMGTVYKARDRALDRTVALKVIRRDMASRPEILERFKREILLASRVTHRNVLRIHDLGEAGGVRFLSMNYVEGSNLKELLEREGPLPPERALPIVRQIAEALQAAHEAGIVHRDLKPQNILIDGAGNAYISDFGISRSIESGGTMTETGAILGTVDYMSPEQARGETPDHRGDIYALGVILYEIFTGSLPFRSDNPLSVMMKRIHQDAPTVRQARPDLPAWISAIVARAMARDPDARYPSARALLRDLDRHRASIAWRRPLVRVALPSLVVAALLAGAVPFVARRLPRFWKRGGAGSVPAQSVALLPFENGTGNPALDWIGTAFPTLISNGLREAPEIRLVGGDRTHQTLTDLKLPQTGAYGAFDLKRASSVLGADLVVTGVVRRAGDLFQAEARLHRSGAQGTQEVGVERAEGRGEESIFALADSLAARIAGALRVRPATTAGARQATTRSVEALRSYSLGLALTRSGRDLDAVTQLEAAITKDPGFALAYALLSQAYDRVGRRDQALVASDKAVRNLAGVSAHEARFIRARRALLSNRLDDGIAEYRELLRSYPQDVDTHLELGKVLEQKGDLQGAAGEFERCLSLDPTYAQALYGLGRVRTFLGDNDGAFKVLNDLLASYTQAGNDEGIGTALLALGNVQMQMGRYPEALTHFQQSLDIRTKIGDRRGMAISLSQIANILSAQGKYDEAVTTCRKAVDLQKEIGDPRGLAMQWGDLGEIYESAGRIRDAQKCYQESLRIVRDLDDPRLLARTFSSLGYVSSVLGDYVQAYFFYQESLTRRRAGGDKRELLRALIDIGLLEQFQGRYDKALAYAAEGMSLARDIGESAGSVVLATNVGMIHNDQGGYEAAIKSLNEAVSGARTLGDTSLLASALLSLGDTLVHLGDPAEAEKSLEEAARLAEESRSSALMPEIMIGQASLQGERGDVPRCLKTLGDALRRAESLGDRRLLLMTRLSLGQWSIAAGRAEGRGHLAWVADQAGKSALQPLRIRALSVVASAGLRSKNPGLDAVAAAEQVIEEGGPLGLRESLLASQWVLARRAEGQGRHQDATRIFLEAAQTVREMAAGLEASRLRALFGRKDLARLRREAAEHVSRYGTADDQRTIASTFSSPP